MPRKRKTPLAGSSKENLNPKRRIVRVGNTANRLLGVDTGAMQDALSEFLMHYQALGPFEAYSYTELAFLGILSSTYKCSTVTEIYQFIEELFPDIPADKDWKKAVRHTLARAKCFSFYKPDSQTRHGTAPAKTSFKIKTIYGVVPHQLVNKIVTGLYRKSTAEKEEFRNCQHKWSNYGPEVRELWTNVSSLVEMRVQNRIEIIETAKNPLESLNSPSISTPGQTGVTAEIKSFKQSVTMPVKNRAIEKSRKRLKPLNSPSISIPVQTGVTAEIKSFKQSVTMPVKNRAIEKSGKRLKPLNSPSISTPGQTGATAETKSFQQPVTMPVKKRAIEKSGKRLKPLNSPSISTLGQTGVTAGTESFEQPSMQVHTCIGEIEKSRSSMEPMDSPSISIPCQTDVTAETELFDLFWRKIDFLTSLQYRGGPTMDLLTSDVTAETESFDLFGSEMDHSTSPQYIADDHAMDCSPSEYPTSDNGACGTTWDSNMPAWQTYPAIPYIRDVTLGSHLSELEEPPYPFKPVPGTSSYPLKPVPETPSEGPKTFTSEDLQAVIKANEETYFIFGHKFKRDTLDDVSNKDVEE